MRLYLDDDSASALLARLLSQAGHEVCVPADAGLGGAEDPMHLTFAIRDSRVMLTGNPGTLNCSTTSSSSLAADFRGLSASAGTTDPRRDLTARGIVRALGNLAAAGIPSESQFVILNHWR